jgi:hypothetical protein
MLCPARPALSPNHVEGLCNMQRGEAAASFISETAVRRPPPLVEGSSMGPPGPRPQIQSQGRDSRMQFPAPGWAAGPEEMVSRLGKGVDNGAAD